MSKEQKQQVIEDKDLDQVSGGSKPKVTTGDAPELKKPIYPC